MAFLLSFRIYYLQAMGKIYTTQRKVKKRKQGKISQGKTVKNKKNKKTTTKNRKRKKSIYSIFLKNVQYFMKMRGRIKINNLALLLIQK